MVHLKRFLVGLAAAIAIALLAWLVLWIVQNYGWYLWATVVGMLLCGALYGLGYSLTTKRKPPEPERPRGGGFAE